MPHRHRILQKEILWRPPKCDSRVLATLVPDESRPTHPAESPKRRGQATGGARNTDLPAGWSLLTTPKRTVLKRNWIGQLVNPSESMVCGS